MAHLNFTGVNNMFLQRLFDMKKYGSIDSYEVTANYMGVIYDVTVNVEANKAGELLKRIYG